MLKIFSDDFFLLAHTAGYDFKGMAALVEESAKEATREDHAASAIHRKIREKMEKSRKFRETQERKAKT